MKVMDNTSSENLSKGYYDEDKILFDLVTEVCNEDSLSPKVKGKVSRIIADGDLSQFTSLHKLSTADEQTSVLLGISQQITTELTYNEQTEFNQAILNKIEAKIPGLITDLNKIIDEKEKYQSDHLTNKRSEKIVLNKSAFEKINILMAQEMEKNNLIDSLVSIRLEQLPTFHIQHSELKTLKTQILESKSKILYLQILYNIFTETNNSVKAFSEAHKDIKNSIRETEEQILKYKNIIEQE